MLERNFVALATVALLVGGCGAQASTDYRGTPLAQLHGTIQVSATRPLASAPPPLDAALVWSGERVGAQGKTSVSRPEITTRVPVSGQFPAEFALQIYAPPPDAALFSCFDADPSHPGRIATGTVEALRQGAVDRADPTTILDLYGIDPDSLVVYADADLPAGSDCPVGALSKGYHLFRLAPSPDKPGCVREAPDDPSCNGPWPYAEVPMTTALSLVLSHEDGTAQPPPAPAPAP